jgi:WD40 repeat protein
LDGKFDWRVGVLRPGQRPLQALAIALLAERRDDPAIIERYAEALHATDHGLANIADLLLGEQSGDPRLLLVIDQFEEVFTQSARDSAERFVGNLLDATAVIGGRVHVALAVRADFLPSCLTLPDFAARLQDSVRFALAPMEKGQIEEAVVGPAQAVGCDVEAAVVSVLAEKVSGRSGALPLMQHTLRELWEHRDSSGRLTWDALDKIGGLEGAIAQTADRMLAGFSDDHQRSAVRRIFGRLVHLGEGISDTRRRAPLSEIEADEFPKAILASLVKHRLVVVDQDYAEIAHESLLHEWSTLRVWIEEDRTLLRLRLELSDAARRWTQSGISADELWYGGRLQRALETFANEDLSAEERAFLTASRAERDAVKEAQESAREERLQQAQALAESERQRADAERFAKEAANANAANLLTTSASARFEKGETFAALHEIAAAIENVGGHPLKQAANRLRLGLARQTVPQLAAVLQHPALVYSARLVGHGARLVTTDYEGTVRLFDLEKLDNDEVPSSTVLDEGYHNPPFKARFSDDGRTLISLTRKNTLRLWDAERIEPLSDIELPDFPLYGVALTSDGRLLAVAGGHSASAGLWNARTGRLLLELSVPAGKAKWMDNVALDHNGGLVAASASGRTFVWDTGDGRQVASFDDESQTHSISFRPHRRQIATSTGDGKVNLWDVDSQEKVQAFSGFASIVNTSLFDRAGERLLGLSQGDNPRLWTPDDGLPNSAVVFAIRDRVSRSRFPRTPIQAEFLYDGSRVLTWQANTAALWDVLTGRPVWTIQGHVGGDMTGHITDASISGSGRMVVTASSDKTVRIWRVPGPVASCVRRILDTNTSSRPSSVRKAERVFSVLSEDGSAASPLCVEAARILPTRDADRIDKTSPDDSLEVALDKGEMAVNIIEARTGETISTLTGHENVIHGLRFDQSGMLIATYSGGDGTARVWGREPNGEFSLNALLIQEGIKGITFNRSGTLLALATEENCVVLWDVVERKLISRVVGSFGPVSSCAFDPFGRLVTGFSPDYDNSSDHHIAIWDLTPLDFSPTRLASWVEWYTGTRWSPNVPGGVNGLTIDEWEERRSTLGVSGRGS